MRTVCRNLLSQNITLIKRKIIKSLKWFTTHSLIILNIIIFISCCLVRVIKTNKTGFNKGNAFISSQTPSLF